MQNVDGASGLLRCVGSRNEDHVTHVVDGNEVQHVLGVALNQLDDTDLDRIDESTACRQGFGPANHRVFISANDDRRSDNSDPCLSLTLLHRALGQCFCEGVSVRVFANNFLLLLDDLLRVQSQDLLNESLGVLIAFQRVNFFFDTAGTIRIRVGC